MRYPLQNQAELLMARLAFALIPRLRRRTILRLARFFGGAGYRFSRKLKRIGFANLDIAFGDGMTGERKREILRASFCNMSLVILDSFWFSRDTGEKLDHYVSFDSSFDALFKEKSHVVITAHYGNWEILGQGITRRGFPLNSVAKPLKNPYVDELFVEARKSIGQKIIKRKGAIRSLMRVLQDGGKIGLVMDQNTKLLEGGKMFPFFGLPASFATTGAALALKTGSDIALVGLVPRDDGTYSGIRCRELSIAPYQAEDGAKGTAELTRVIVEDMESMIREAPEYWLWTYKRWKYIPEGDDPEKYPFYRRAAV